MHRGQRGSQYASGWTCWLRSGGTLWHVCTLGVECVYRRRNDLLAFVQQPKSSWLLISLHEPNTKPLHNSLQFQRIWKIDYLQRARSCVTAGTQLCTSAAGATALSAGNTITQFVVCACYSPVPNCTPGVNCKIAKNSPPTSAYYDPPPFYDFCTWHLKSTEKLPQFFHFCAFWGLFPTFLLIFAHPTK